MHCVYLSLPRELGEHPDGTKLTAAIGRFGPYVKKGSEFRSIPKHLDVYEITLEQAVELVNSPKVGRGGRVAAPPVKTFAESPVTGKVIEIKDGKYGMYVTDGETNATLPKEQNPEEFTFEQAVSLLAERAATSTKKGKTAKSAKKAAKESGEEDAKKATKKKATKKSAKKSADADDEE